MQTESRWGVIRGWRNGKWEVTSNGYEVSLWSEENVLELESDDVCISTIELYTLHRWNVVCELYLNNVVIITEINQTNKAYVKITIVAII